MVHSFFENSMCYAGHIIARYAKTVHDPENETKILNRVKGNFITLEETNLSIAHQVQDHLRVTKPHRKDELKKDMNTSMVSNKLMELIIPKAEITNTYF